MMRLTVLFVALLLPLFVQAEPMDASIPPRGQRVVVISIDGARPDVLMRAQTPHVRSLMQRGSFSLWARTTDIAITLPSHASMISGVSPEVHGIHWNHDIPLDEVRFSQSPTLFELAHQAGLSTGLVAGKSKFIALATPGSVDWIDIPQPESGFDDLDVGAKAALMIESQQPQVLLVHFGGPDGAGHAHGWGSDEQVAALAKADKGVGLVLDALQRQGLAEETLIILSSDHGGAGKGHGPGDMRSRYIPWIAAGPGVRQNVDLTLYPDLHVKTEDTFATACNFLGLTPPSPVIGAPVLEIWEEFEALRTEPTPPTTEPAYAPATQPADAVMNGSR